MRVVRCCACIWKDGVLQQPIHSARSLTVLTYYNRRDEQITQSRLDYIVTPVRMVHAAATWTDAVAARSLQKIPDTVIRDHVPVRGVFDVQLRYQQVHSQPEAFKCDQDALMRAVGRGVHVAEYLSEAIKEMERD